MYQVDDLQDCSNETYINGLVHEQWSYTPLLMH